MQSSAASASASRKLDIGPAPADSPGVGAAAMDAAKSALLVIGLATPIVLIETKQSGAGVALEWRFGLVAVLAAIAALARFIHLTVVGPRVRAMPASNMAGRFSPGTVTWIKRFALVFVLLYPFIALALAGKGGAIKWIDNFGIQLLI